MCASNSFSLQSWIQMVHFLSRNIKIKYGNYSVIFAWKTDSFAYIDLVFVIGLEPIPPFDIFLTVIIFVWNVCCERFFSLQTVLVCN